MATLVSLQSELKRIRSQAVRQTSPRQWVFLLFEGEEIPEVIRAKIRPDDQVYVKQLVEGYLFPAADNASYGYVSGPAGALVIRRDGTLEKVVKK